jgi:uncharacterized membrane protein YoaK (UPF0700 family)
MLVSLTLATGLVDAVSYIRLGHVFVANMTGNVVFLGFALAGAGGLSAVASLVALGAFLVGAFVGGRLSVLTGAHRGRQLRTTTAVEATLVAAALLVALLGDGPPGKATQYTLIVLLALAMGIQNSSARRLGVPDLTTTVLTQTLTGVAADAPALGGTTDGKLARRLLAVAAMFTGALLGGLMVVHISLSAPLAVALAVLALIACCAQALARSPGAWTRAAARS